VSSKICTGECGYLCTPQVSTSTPAKSRWMLHLGSREMRAKCSRRSQRSFRRTTTTGNRAALRFTGPRSPRPPPLACISASTGDSCRIKSMTLKVADSPWDGAPGPETTQLPTPRKPLLPALTLALAVRLVKGGVPGFMAVGALVLWLPRGGVPAPPDG